MHRGMAEPVPSRCPSPSTRTVRANPTSQPSPLSLSPWATATPPHFSLPIALQQIRTPGIKGSAPQPWDPAPAGDHRQAGLGTGRMGRRKLPSLPSNSSGLCASALGSPKEGAAELELCPGSVLAGCHQPRATSLCAGESPYGGTGLRGDTRQEWLATPPTGGRLTPWASSGMAGHPRKAQTWLGWN